MTLRTAATLLLCCELITACTDKKPSPHNNSAASPQDVGVAIRVDSPQGRNIYLGAYPSMPTGSIDLSKTIELGAEMTGFYNGWVFMYDNDSQILSRYGLQSDGTLQADSAQLSFEQIGLGGYISYAFVSPTRAYLFNDFMLNKPIVAWNPTTMEIIEQASTSNLVADKTLYDESYFSIPVLFGGYVALTVEYDSDDGSATYPQSRVVLIDQNSLTAANAVSYVDDPRCGGATDLFLDPNGDMYVVGTSAYGAFQVFPTNPNTMPPACLLRIKAGTTTYDPTFYINLLESLGTQAVFQAWYVGGTKMLLLTLPAGAHFTDLNDFYENATWTPMLVDITTGTGTPMAGIPVTTVENTYTFTLNGALVYQSYHADGSGVTLYGISSDGVAAELFSTAGDFWGIGTLQTH